MSKGLIVIKEKNNLAEWSRQVEECRSSGLSVRAWCDQNGNIHILAKESVGGV